jgi:transcriptional regulator with XRE-family HTH domain
MIIDLFLKDLIGNGWKQKEIAEKCGFSPQHINRILKTGKAELVTIGKIAKAFDKPVSMFLDDEIKVEPMLTKKEEKLLEMLRSEEGLIDEILKNTEKEKLYRETMKRKVA